MCKAIDVANFFIDMANNDPDDCMTNLRVNKLLYFAQAWSLVRIGKRLFDGQIQAWKYGPVVPEVYQAFKQYGRERIPSVSGEYSPDIFNSDELNLLLDVLREYGKYSSPALVDFTHADGTPWKEVYSPSQSGTVISDESLKRYFSTQDALKSYKAPSISDCDFIGERDRSDGILVLPKEYDDDTE